MKLKEGMYVRTFEGNIFKILGLKDELIYISNTECHFYKSLYGGDYCFRFPNENNHYTITKASYNIIDLIEEGDTLDFEFGGIVCKSDILKEDNKLGVGWDDDGNFINLESVYIKSIVTKEQFEAIKYEIK